MEYLLYLAEDLEIVNLTFDKMSIFPTRVSQLTTSLYWEMPLSLQTKEPSPPYHAAFGVYNTACMAGGNCFIRGRGVEVVVTGNRVI
jgi:hypothetical protein